MCTWSMDSLLVRMHELGASDLLITAGTVPQYRCNGSLVPDGHLEFSAADTERLARRFLGERFAVFESDRTLDISRGIEGLCRVRLSFYYQRGAVAIAARQIPFTIPSMEELGLPPLVRELALRPHGLVLITGPAGSGKSTTMAAMLDYINSVNRLHVICIEDPIEYVHAHRKCVIDQREVGSDAKSFTEALRSVFRQSPDVIMIGEMRDLETIQLALTLAETGHLILATLHTQDTTHAINRIVDSFPSGQQQQVYTQLSLVLLGIISQQLITTSDGSRRVLACEVMHATSAVRNLIREMQVQQIYSLVQTGQSHNMITMNDSLARLCAEGLIDKDTALLRSSRRDELTRLLAVEDGRGRQKHGRW